METGGVSFMDEGQDETQEYGEEAEEEGLHEPDENEEEEHGPEIAAYIVYQDEDESWILAALDGARNHVQQCSLPALSKGSAYQLLGFPANPESYYVWDGQAGHNLIYCSEYMAANASSGASGGAAAGPHPAGGIRDRSARLVPYVKPPPPKPLAKTGKAATLASIAVAPKLLPGMGPPKSAAPTIHSDLAPNWGAELQG